MVTVGAALGYAAQAKALADFAEKAWKWREDFAKRSRNEAEQRDARLLAGSGVLVAAMRTLDNTTRELLGELRDFDVSWPPERRSEVMVHVRRFSDSEQILPILRQALAEMEMLNVGRSAPEWTERLVDCGRSILAALGDSPATPFRSSEELTRFMRDVKSATTVEQVDAVVAAAHESVNAFNRSTLADADRAYGFLKAQIHERHPSLSDPGWAVILSPTRLP
jgi:hypothetical protein